MLKNRNSEKPWVEAMKEESDYLFLKLDRFQSALIESIREGILLISDTLQPICLNLKATEIYDQLWNGNLQSTLPPILLDISRQLFQGLSPEGESLIIDYQIGVEQTIRIRACQFTHSFDPEVRECSDNRYYIVVFLEDRNVTLAEELKIERRKYDFTERETQIFRLLLQAYSYQDIAETLQISLNTVKFHVKNIYFKKRSYLEQNRT